MTLRDLLSETFLSLASNKARSFLTVLGIVVGITSVIVMVSIGQGTKASIEESISSVGSNLITVMSEGASGGGASTVTMEDGDAIARQVQGVKAVAPVQQASYTVVANSENADVSILGSTADYPAIRTLETSLGAWFDTQADSDAEKVAVLGPTTSETLFGVGSNAVGARIRINGVPFKVVGVAKSKGSSGMSNTDDMVYVPLATLQRYLAGSDDINSLYVQAESQDQMTSVKQGITALLNARHDITDSNNADFRVMSQEDLAQTASTVTGLLTVLLGSIAGISLVVGGIGIMNMMLTTVTERIREIGLRKAVGATRSDVSSQFLAESVALTVTGGVVGIALGWMISFAIRSFSSLNTSVTPASVLLAVGVSTFIGIAFGYYPARRAAKLDPIEALRYQ